MKFVVTFIVTHILYTTTQLLYQKDEFIICLHSAYKEHIIYRPNHIYSSDQIRLKTLNIDTICRQWYKQVGDLPK